MPTPVSCGRPGARQPAGAAADGPQVPPGAPRRRRLPRGSAPAPLAGRHVRRFRPWRERRGEAAARNARRLDRHAPVRRDLAAPRLPVHRAGRAARISRRCRRLAGARSVRHRVGAPIERLHAVAASAHPQRSPLRRSVSRTWSRSEAGCRASSAGTPADGRSAHLAQVDRPSLSATPRRRFTWNAKRRQSISTSRCRSVEALSSSASTSGLCIQTTCMIAYRRPRCRTLQVRSSLLGSAGVT